MLLLWLLYTLTAIHTTLSSSVAMVTYTLTVIHAKPSCCCYGYCIPYCHLQTPSSTLMASIQLGLQHAVSEGLSSNLVHPQAFFNSTFDHWQYQRWKAWEIS